MVIATHLHAHLIQRELDRLYELHQHNYTCCKCRITLSAAAVQPPRGETQQLCSNPERGSNWDSLNCLVWLKAPGEFQVSYT